MSIVANVVQGNEQEEGLHAECNVPRILNGVDGISPTVTVTPITGGHRITITDREHQGENALTFDVLDACEASAGKGIKIANRKISLSLDDLIAQQTINYNDYIPFHDDFVGADKRITVNNLMYRMGTFSQNRIGFAPAAPGMDGKTFLCSDGTWKRPESVTPFAVNEITGNTEGFVKFSILGTSPIHFARIGEKNYQTSEQGMSNVYFDVPCFMDFTDGTEFIVSPVAGYTQLAALTGNKKATQPAGEVYCYMKIEDGKLKLFNFNPNVTAISEGSYAVESITPVVLGGGS